MGGSCSLGGEKCGDSGVKPKVLWDFNEKQEITDTRTTSSLAGSLGLRCRHCEGHIIGNSTPDLFPGEKSRDTLQRNSYACRRAEALDWQ